MNVAAFLLALVLGLLAGYIGHEVAHWLVLRVGGYDAGLSLWPPQAGVRTPQPVPLLVRVAAVAPLLLGFYVVVYGAVLGGLWMVAAIGAGARLCYLSQSDVRLARGIVAE